VFISRQVGHSTSATTLGVYAHLFDKANHAEGMRQALSARFDGLLAWNAVETTRRNETQHRLGEMAQLTRAIHGHTCSPPRKPESQLAPS
jgi:hypothetical protein